MQLKLRRSQRSAGMLKKSVMFMLDARLDLTPDEAADVRKYAFGSQVIYNSATSLKHLQAAVNAREDITPASFVTHLAQTAMHRLSLNITIDSLVQGHHIECKDIDELLGAENALHQACTTTATYLDLVKTFDGRELIHEFSAPPEFAA